MSSRTWPMFELVALTSSTDGIFAKEYFNVFCGRWFPALLVFRLSQTKSANSWAFRLLWTSPKQSLSSGLSRRCVRFITFYVFLHTYPERTFSLTSFSESVQESFTLTSFRDVPFASIVNWNFKTKALPAGNVSSFDIWWLLRHFQKQLNYSWVFNCIALYSHFWPKTLKLYSNDHVETVIFSCTGQTLSRARFVRAPITSFRVQGQSHGPETTAVAFA